MKKIFTLTAAATLAAASLSAQAQVTVDGVLNAAEIGSGNYVLVGKFTGARGFGSYGLLSLYAASTTTKVYLFLAGTVQNNGNSLQIFLKTPAATGVPFGTALPGTGTSGTSFDGMTAKLDMATNAALALRYNATYVVEGAAYTSASVATAAVLSTGTNPGDGSVATLAANAAAPTFAGARVAYKATSDGTITTNPGYNTNPTQASYGAAGSYGLEVELDRTAAGLTGASALTLFALQNNNNGSYLSSDFIPQSPTATGNLAAAGAVDFTTIAGLQAATINLAATGGTTLASKAAAEALALGVYPNPAADLATVSYKVAAASSPVSIALVDLLGRPVRVVESGLKNAGPQTVSFRTGDLAAGTYLLRVQVGDNVATSKVSVL